MKNLEHSVLVIDNTTKPGQCPKTHKCDRNPTMKSTTFHRHSIFPKVFLLLVLVCPLILATAASTVNSGSASRAANLKTDGPNVDINVDNDVVVDTNATTANGTHHSGERFPLMVEDFARVQTAFIISLWVFCACLGKIGEFKVF